MTPLAATVSIGMPTNSLLRQHAQKFGKLGCVHVVADIDGQTDIETLVTILRSPIGKHVTFAYCAVRTKLPQAPEMVLSGHYYVSDIFD